MCASFLLRKPLAGYYITNITDAWVPFTGVIEMSALVDPANLGGTPWFTCPNTSLKPTPSGRRRYRNPRHLRGRAGAMYPGFDRGDLLAFQVARVREMLAVST